MSLHEEDNIKKKYDNISGFCSNYVYLQPHDPLEDEKNSLAYEGCKMKDNYEGDEFTSSFFVGDLKIMQRDVHNSDLCVSLCHNDERFETSEHPNPTITIVQRYEPSSLASGKA